MQQELKKWAKKVALDCFLSLTSQVKSQEGTLGSAMETWTLDTWDFVGPRPSRLGR